jgi:hypothetical protein
MLQTRVEAAETLVTSQGCKVESVGGPIPDSNCQKKSLALAGWCARMGGLVAYFRACNHCNLPRHAHQLASADKKSVVQLFNSA